MDPLPEQTNADFAELEGAVWEAWRAANPEAAEEIELSRRVRQLLVALHEAEFAVPEGFEARLMERLREDRALVDLIDLWVSGIGRAVLELLALIFALLPQPAPQPQSNAI
jgi:hypothetical protein